MSVPQHGWRCETQIEDVPADRGTAATHPHGKVVIVDDVELDYSAPQRAVEAVMSVSPARRVQTGYIPIVGLEKDMLCLSHSRRTLCRTGSATSTIPPPRREAIVTRRRQAERTAGTTLER
jgi:hypothetical protein